MDMSSVTVVLYGVSESYAFGAAVSDFKRIYGQRAYVVRIDDGTESEKLDPAYILQRDHIYEIRFRSELFESKLTHHICNLPLKTCRKLAYKKKFTREHDTKEFRKVKALKKSADAMKESLPAVECGVSEGLCLQMEMCMKEIATSM